MLNALIDLSLIPRVFFNVFHDFFVLWRRYQLHWINMFLESENAAVRTLHTWYKSV